MVYPPVIHLGHKWSHLYIAVEPNKLAVSALKTC